MCGRTLLVVVVVFFFFPFHFFVLVRDEAPVPTLDKGNDSHLYSLDMSFWSSSWWSLYMPYVLKYFRPYWCCSYNTGGKNSLICAKQPFHV